MWYITLSRQATNEKQGDFKAGLESPKGSHKTLPNNGNRNMCVQATHATFCEIVKKFNDLYDNDFRPLTKMFFLPKSDHRINCGYNPSSLVWRLRSLFAQHPLSHPTPPHLHPIVGSAAFSECSTSFIQNMFLFCAVCHQKRVQVHKINRLDLVFLAMN